MDADEPFETLVIQAQAQWKALAHPLRLSIVRLLRQKAMTNEELAHSLDVASGKLYFHTKLLLDAGLIRLVGTRQKQAITEKLYRATAKRFRAAISLDGEDTSDELENALELYRNTLKEHPALLSSDRSLFDHNLFLLSPKKADELRRKLRALIQDGLDSKSAAADAVPLALTVLLYPLPGPVRPTGEAGSSERKTKENEP